MKLIGAFLRLVRWPNLVFIALTQLLFYYCLQLPSFNVNGVVYPHKLSWPLFACISLSSVLIAAAGYVINDYFDLNIDRLNKPDKLIVDKLIRRRWAILWHLGLSAAGVLLGVWVGLKTGNHLIGPANLMCVVLLWVYSTSLKKKMLIGNILISLLTAWVVLVIWFCEIRIGKTYPGFTAVQTRIYKFGVLYASFAFIISLIREVVKDMEDMYGDEKYGCRTMPIVWGINASKLFIVTWMVVLTAAVLIIQVYAFQLKWWWSSIYSILFILVPLILLFRPLMAASQPEHFYKISSRIKLVMMTGILSMIFFSIYG